MPEGSGATWLTKEVATYIDGVPDIGAAEHNDPDLQHIQNQIVALDQRGISVPALVALERDCGALRRAAVPQHRVGLLGVNPAELIPD